MGGDIQTVSLTLPGDGSSVTIDLAENSQSYSPPADASDEERTTLSYEWDCDNNEDFGQNPTERCAYNVPGTYIVKLTVEDRADIFGDPGCRKTATDTLTVFVRLP